MLQPQPNFQIILVPANMVFFFIFFKGFFIHLSLAVLVVAAAGLRPVMVSGGYSLTWTERGLQVLRLQWLWLTGLLPPGVWDLPRPGTEPVSPALAGRLITTGPPVRPPGNVFNLLRDSKENLRVKQC